MACYEPVSGYRHRETMEFVFGERRPLATHERLSLPCGRCIGCKLERARQWSVRICHEASLYDSNFFVTLDYDPKGEESPESTGNWGLQYPHFQKFMRRVRKCGELRVAGDGVASAIRFFVAGEYGRRHGRPHWHAILFNLALPDKVSLANGKFQSTRLEELWSHGHCDVGSVNPASASYVAGYTLEKVSASEYVSKEGEVVRPPFVCMSLKPGIGAQWYSRFSGDLFPHDFAVQDGKKYKVPRYYSKKYESYCRLRKLTWELAVLKEKRDAQARVQPIEEQSPERRLVRKKVAVAKYEFYHQREH